MHSSGRSRRGNLPSGACVFCGFHLDQGAMAVGICERFVCRLRRQIELAATLRTSRA